MDELVRGERELDAWFGFSLQARGVFLGACSVGGGGTGTVAHALGLPIRLTYYVSSTFMSE
jgi:hypothetical protein